MPIEPSKIPINFEKVTPSSQVKGDDVEETRELKVLRTILLLLDNPLPRIKSTAKLLARNSRYHLPA